MILEKERLGGVTKCWIWSWDRSIASAQFQMSATWICEHDASGSLGIYLWHLRSGGEREWRYQVDVSFICLMSVTKTDHWKNHSEEEDPGCTIGFPKPWVPAAQLCSVGTKLSMVGEEHIPTPLTNPWDPDGAERLEMRHWHFAYCSSRMPQKTASPKGSGVPSEVTSSHILARHIPHVVGRQWMSKKG